MSRTLISLIILSAWTTPVNAQKINQAKPWLGVAIEAHAEGILVKQAIADTPAQKAGIQSGDIIFQVDKQKVNTPQDLINAVLTSGVGTTVTIHFLRAKKNEKRTLQLVARPDDLALVKQKLLDKPAPDFDLKVISGNGKGKLSANRGKVVLIEFWATWCVACRATHAQLSELAATDKNIEILAISDEEADVLAPYVAKHKPKFTVLSDPKHETHGKWVVTAIPALGVIDKEGVVRHITIGAGKYLDEAIAVAKKLAAK